MDSALRPREIQARIRAGESLEEVARLSGAPADRIERFAAPVLAEREYIAGLALASSVRRHGEPGSHRTLGAVTREQLLAHGTDPESAVWDAWRNEDKRWTIVARWTQADEERSARFLFDLGGRFSVADDAESRWLLAEDEEAAERDELALVRVVGEDPPTATADPEPEVPSTFDPDEEPTITLDDVPGHLLRAEGEEPDEWFPRSVASPQEIREELEAEIDAYGVVPEGRSELDVLYDMLGGIAEDSINIYSGLTDPIVAEAPAGPDPEPVIAEQQEDRPEAQPEQSVPDQQESQPEQSAPDQPAGSQPEPAQPESAQPEPAQPRPVIDAVVMTEPDPASSRPEPASEPETDPVIEPAASQSESMASPQQPEPAPGPAEPVMAPESVTRLQPVSDAPVESTPDADAEPSGTASREQQPMPVAPGEPQETRDVPTEPPARVQRERAEAEPTLVRPLDAPARTEPLQPSGQPALVDDEPTVQVAPGAAKRRGARKKRASVPSWDEIMFGGPKPE